VPGPIYILHSDWRKHLPPRGKFLKGRKELFTETVFKREKFKVPPTAYNVLEAKKNYVQGALKLTDSHINFTEEAKWQGLQTPHVNYTKNFDQVSKRIKNSVNMSARSVSQQDISWKIPKSDPVGPGCYDMMKSYASTQKLRILGHEGANRKSNRLDYVDCYSKHFKENPPPNKYSDMDKGRALQSKPLELKVYRH